MSKSMRVQRRALPLVNFNRRLRMNGIDLLSKVPDGAVAAMWFDPQYRGVLDHLKFGNEGKRQQERAELPQMDDGQIMFFLEEGARVVAPSGHIFLWADKFTIASGRHLQWLRHARDEIAIVDLISWFKGTFGMGRRSRGVTEYLVILQRKPTRAKGVWTDNSIRDGWQEDHDRSLHPHAKPVALIERIVRATTKRGDIVVDPAAGGFGVLRACRVSGRSFFGCDLKTGDEEWDEESCPTK